MKIAALLTLFCLLIGAMSLGLSTTAGHLPGVVAGLTLVPALAQLRREWQRNGGLANAGPAPANGLDWRSYCLLLAGLYLAGFLVALPLFAAWSWRKRPGVAAGALAAVLFALVLLGRQVDLYPGVLWSR